MTALTIGISNAKLPDGEVFEKYASDQLEEYQKMVDANYGNSKNYKS